MKPRPVKVLWQDAESWTRWDTWEHHCKREPYIVTTVGFELERDKKKICVALSINEDGIASDVITIPRGCVKKITRP
jgi:hypothetical protein